jgi:hypothetical protein
MVLRYQFQFLLLFLYLLLSQFQKKMLLHYLLQYQQQNLPHQRLQCLVPHLLLSPRLDLLQSLLHFLCLYLILYQWHLLKN